MSVLLAFGIDRVEADCSLVIVADTMNNAIRDVSFERNIPQNYPRLGCNFKC